MAAEKKQDFAPGMRVVIRDAEWLIKSVDAQVKNAPKARNQMLTCIGVSNLVAGKEAHFLTGFEDDIQILDPKKTKLVQDTSQRYVKSKLFIDSLLRRTPATDTKIHIAQDAAMDILPYQLEPTTMALESTRPRILIADAVGIGKTLEAGILVSELIERQRGKRILVLAVKAMLEQFQQEFWNRFSIPLTRLDSDGIARLQQKIPASHNPFLYVDKAIISIDTLKQDVQYRTYLETAHWDIIIIDEAHNVAERGSNSQRSRLARLLSEKSDALIMLSATPHDGRPESFASLIDMLDPTVIADPSNYTADEFKDKGLVIRRFKNDIRDQANAAFPERDIDTIKINASAQEQAAFLELEQIEFGDVDKKHQIGTMLFKTTLEKALFSSPQACLSTIANRIKRLEAKAVKDSNVEKDILTLKSLQSTVEGISIKAFSKYQKLVALLDPKNKTADFANWTGKNPEDRLVIFTESRQTLDFLTKNLPKDIGLKDSAVCSLKGDDKDKDLMDAVERFNQKESPLRLMLATDVASEGLNLHRFSHRMIHFDIPWSLMTFQQRNGRIDRYGQKYQPMIRYLMTVPANDTKTFGDTRVLERLIEKDNNAVQNISDPGEFSGSKEEQENRTAAEIQGEVKVDMSAAFDPLAAFTAMVTNATPEVNAEKKSQPTVNRSLLFKDFDFMKEALNYRRHLPLNDGGIATSVEISEEDNRITFDPPADFDVRLQYLPKEVLPENRRFQLTTDSQKVQEAIRNAAMNPNSSWPTLQLLWELHPAMQWVEDWSIGSFGRHSAPVVKLSTLEPGEFWYLIQGGFPNRNGGTPVHDWIAVKCDNSGNLEAHARKDLMDLLPKKEWPNTAQAIDTELFARMMPEAVDVAKNLLNQKREEYEQKMKPLAEEKLKELDQLREKQLTLWDDKKNALGTGANAGLFSRQANRVEERKQLIEKRFESAQMYTENTYSLNDEPYVQVVAVFTGEVKAYTPSQKVLNGHFGRLFE